MLWRWIRQVERDAGKIAGPTSAELAWVRELEREVRQANEILLHGLGVFCGGGALDITKEAPLDRLVPLSDAAVTEAELSYVIERETPMTVSDVMVRRTDTYF